MWEGMENQRPAAWRIVFKALTLLEFLVKNGAERCVDDARNHAHFLRALLKFNYYEGTIDRGLGVREKTKQLLDILTDDERIREERQRARQLRDKFKGNKSVASNSRSGGGGYEGYGKEDNWNSGGADGAYGNGGIDSDKGYSGRYGGSSGGGPTASPSPTFASLPAEKKKKKKKKKKAVVEADPAPAPQPGKCAALGVGELLNIKPLEYAY
jgi:epsin